MTVKKAIDEIIDELIRAEKQHPEWPQDIIHGVAIMVEEAGEATQAAIDITYADGSRKKLRMELIQTAAMALRNLINLEE